MPDFTDTNPNAGLFPDRRTRSVWDVELGRYLAKVAVRIQQESIAPRADLTELRATMQAFDSLVRGKPHAMQTTTS